MTTKPDLPNAAHQERVRAFAEAVRTSDGAASAWWSTVDYLWHVRAETPDGMFHLELPDGGGFPSLESLLRILAGEGVTRILVEFDGLNPMFYDRIN